MSILTQAPIVIQSVLRKHKDRLWWIHSFYALLLGVAIMWLGSLDFTYLRVAIFHLLFIWISSLFLPVIGRMPGLDARWCERLRLAVNYFNKNFYQQILFFIIPIYAASMTPGSRNMLFVALLGVSAVLSTLDIVYDRYLSLKWNLVTLFFAFNLFACINAMLPILWGVSNSMAIRLSAVIAIGAYGSMCWRLSDLRGNQRRAVALAGALLLLALVELGRPFIPPAPLRLVKVEFSDAIQRRPLRIGRPLPELTALGPQRVFALTSIQAPLGLRERIRHRWSLRGKTLFESPFYEIVGGRKDGFRLWTYCWVKDLQPGDTVRLRVETEGDQLVGDAAVKCAPTGALSIEREGPIPKSLARR